MAKATSKKKPRAKVAKGRKAPARPRRATPRAAPRRAAANRRSDFGAPIEGYLSRQPPPARDILEALRTLVQEAAPDATSGLKWGMPCFEVGGKLVCAMAGFRAHVNLILPSLPGTDYADPRGLLEGSGKRGRHLKIRALGELPRPEVRRWLQSAARAARARGGG